MFRHAPPGSHHPSVHPPSETTAICSLGYFNFRNVDFGFFFFKTLLFPLGSPRIKAQGSLFAKSVGIMYIEASFPWRIVIERDTVVAVSNMATVGLITETLG